MLNSKINWFNQNIISQNIQNIKYNIIGLQTVFAVFRIKWNNLNLNLTNPSQWYH